MVLEKMGCVTMTKKRFLFYFYILLFFVCFILVQRFHHNVPKLAIPSSRKSANLSKSDTNILHTTKLPLKITKKKSTHLSKTTEFPLICPLTNTNQTCPTNNYPTTMDDDDDDDEQEIISTLESCPDYFRWIHEDLKPWKTKGITKEMVEAGKSTAHFRLVILDGRIYVEKYKRAYQTRDVTTIWGFLQLLRLYPGKLPDLDLMFNCDDKPVIKKSDYEAAVNPNPNPIPMFHYCGDDEHLDIPFPDWSFWGWHEVNIKPWELQLEEIKKGNENVKWVDRLPNAYWKGNLQTGNRIYLNKCNSSRKWNTEIYEQHWALEVKHGFRESNIADQCNYRYKIYMEGKAWSTSEKYIQACDSMLLLVQPRYYEFFTRGLLPLTHYWPINPSKLCESLKFAVKWGNKNPNKPSLAATRLMRKTLPSSASNEIIKQTVFPLQCITGTNDSTIQTCPSNYPTTFNPIDPTTRTCPDYLKWIHEDLQPWRSSGITKEMVEAAKEVAFFRLVVVDGKVYWEKYRDSYQTRDVFTIWGILQLLRLYPGKLPDFDIMFGAGDVPIIHKSNYTNPSDAPPFFHYCGDDQTLDIAFPDWSFWGWPEINIKGWEGLKKDLAGGNNRVSWMDRLPFAFWKGNTIMGDRVKLLQCNSTDQWKAQIATQDWEQETKLGFKSSNLADQCVHRYKIYIEGIAWSVSEKYILACNSVALLVTPKWYEFFTRSLMPMKHYWPINPDPENLCKSIKFAVDWGNKHREKAQKIGKAGSKFVQEQLMMDNVYDYMFHLLNEYAKLLRYKPTIPPGANETCSEKMACFEEGLQKQFRLDSMVKGPSKKNPCILQPPQEPQVIKAFLDKQDSIRRRVDVWAAKGSASGDL